MTLSVQSVEEGPLLVSHSLEVPESIFNDVIVQRNCSLRIGGNLRGDLTIEKGARVLVEGAVEGKIINRGGRLVVNNKGLAAFVAVEGPSDAVAGGVLKISLSAIASNWERLGKRTEAECAGVVKANAYGCGIDQIATALVKCGCRTFFVTDIPEARCVRAVARNATIYVLNGVHSGSAPAFAEVDARPVINSCIELAEWDVFAASHPWTGGCALNVDTGASRFGLSMEEAAAMAARLHSRGHGISLLMSRLDHLEKPDRVMHQIKRFSNLRQLYVGVPASLANSSGIFLGADAHFDLVRAGSALYGLNPVPGNSNPMVPVVELRARIVQVRTLEPSRDDTR